jgi:arginine decarboxylase
MVPKEVFFTSGVGVHARELQSFELALRDAGIEICNLVTVSSIFPPNCKIIPKKQGLKKLKPGAITHCVMARIASNEPNRLCAAGIGLAVPANGHEYGYISEHHGYGMKKNRCADLVEDMAATMLATTLGIEFDPDKAYDERKEIYRMSGKIIKSRAEVKTAEGNKDGLWTTVVSAAVFIME